MPDLEPSNEPVEKYVAKVKSCIAKHEIAVRLGEDVSPVKLPKLALGGGLHVGRIRVGRRATFFGGGPQIESRLLRGGRERFAMRRPFVNGAAVFLLADASMKSCDELHGDGCRTPWDYCCEPRESLAAKIATIQIIDADGRPLRMSLTGRHGLAPLAEITVLGEIAQRSDSGTLVINARKIHVKAREG